MAEWSHCTECGETGGTFDFNGVCWPCRQWFAEEERKFNAERAEDAYWRAFEAREARMFNESSDLKLIEF